MKHLILFGVKHSGKKYFGHLLAEKLGRAFIDTDDLIVHLYQEKLTAAEIRQSLGEKRFRDLERKAIQSLQPKNLSIISLGEGAILHPENFLHVKKIGKLVYLKNHFPMNPSQTVENKNVFSESLCTLHEEKKHPYESIPVPHIDVSSLSEQAILERLHHLATQEHEFHPTHS